MKNCKVSINRMKKQWEMQDWDYDIRSYEFYKKIISSIHTSEKIKEIYKNKMIEMREKYKNHPIALKAFSF